MDDADAAIAAELEVKNPFPTPPAYWMRYTPENVRLLGLLKDKLGQRGDLNKAADKPSGDEAIEQEVLLPDETLLPSFPLLELEPPRLDWILEQEEYSSFGEIYPTNETVQAFPSGLNRLCNLEPGADPRPHLRQLLVSLLNAYHKLISDVLEPVPSGYHKPPTSEPDGNLHGSREEETRANIEWPPPLNWEATILWIRTLVLNMGWLVNEFRPIQARTSLESMMQRQIELRREETKTIHGKCDELERTLAELRTKTAALLPPTDSVPAAELRSQAARADAKQDQAAELEVASISQTPIPISTTEDLIAWSQAGIRWPIAT